MNIWKLSWKNLWAKPLHNLMSVLLIALSTALLVFILLFNHQFNKGLTNNLAGVDLILGAKGSPLQLVLNSMYHIDAPTGNIPLEAAGPFLNPGHPLLAKAVPLSLGDSYGAFRIVGTTPSILPFYGVKSIDGELFEKDFEVVAGSRAAEKMHLHIGDTFFSTHGLEDNPDLAHDHGAPFVVKGILAPSGTVLDQLFLCTPATVWKVHEHEALPDSTSVDSLPVQDGAHNHEEEHDHDDAHHQGDNDEHGGEHDHAHDHKHVHSKPVYKSVDTVKCQQLTDTIVSHLRASGDKEITSILLQFKNRTSLQSLNLLRNINVNTDMMAASPAIEINRLYSMLGSGTKALQYMAYLIALVGAISVFISLFTSLNDRKYEMAIMRVSGATPGKLLTMILGEGLWIAILGCVIGLILGHGAMTLAGKVLEEGYRYPFTGMIWLREEYFIVIGTLLIGIIAACIPAFRGSKINIHSVLAKGN